MTMFVYSDTKKQELDFTRSEIVNRYLMETVVQFYVDIEFAGQSMFFTKFQYRHDCQKIFQRFWKSERFKEALRKLTG